MSFSTSTKTKPNTTISTVPTSEISSTSFQITSTTFVDKQANTISDTSEKSSSEISTMSTSILTTSSKSNSTVSTEFSTSFPTTTTVSTTTYGYPTNTTSSPTSGYPTTTASTSISGYPTTTASTSTSGYHTTTVLPSEIVSSTPIISTTDSYLSETTTSKTTSEITTTESTTQTFSDTTSKMPQTDYTPVKSETQKVETVKSNNKPQPPGYGGKDFLFAAMKVGQAKQAADSRFAPSVGGLEPASSATKPLMTDEIYEAAMNGEHTRKTTDSGYTSTVVSIESASPVAESSGKNQTKSADKMSHLVTKTVKKSNHNFAGGNQKSNNIFAPEPSNRNPNSNSDARAIDSIFSKTNSSKIIQGNGPVNSTNPKTYNQPNNSVSGVKDANSYMVGNNSKSRQNGFFKQETQNGKYNETSNSFVDKFGNIMKADTSISKEQALDDTMMSTKSDSNFKEHFSSKQDPKLEPIKPYDKNTFKHDDGIKKTTMSIRTLHHLIPNKQKMMV